MNRSKMNESRLSKTVRLYFVLNNKYTCSEEASEELRSTFQCALEWKLQADWVVEEECLNLSNFNKTDVFVFEEFEGNCFNRIKETQCLIVGPQCLRTCFIEGCSIPSNKSPVFTMAMNKLIISASNINNEQKVNVKKMVEYMGGKYRHDLRKDTTHLVVPCSLFTRKYKAAYESGEIKVMKLDWIDAVWNLSKKENVKATDEQFNTYECPVFYKLIITCSGIRGENKNNLVKMIKENGGTYTSGMQLPATNVLVVNEPIGEKYKRARQHYIVCVKEQWVSDSVARGHLAPIENYAIEDGLQASTPSKTNTGENNFDYTNATAVSAICNFTEVSGISESIDTSCGTVSSYKVPCVTPKKVVGTKYEEMLRDIKTDDLRKLESIFDGCNVYLNGFSKNTTERIRNILKCGGGYHYKEFNESITHILTGDTNTQEIIEYSSSIQNRPHLVNLKWLVDCVKHKRLMPEAAYNCASDDSIRVGLDAPSPLSAKGMKMLTPDTIINHNPTKNSEILFTDQYKGISGWYKQRDDVQMSENAKDPSSTPEKRRDGPNFMNHIKRKLNTNDTAELSTPDTPYGQLLKCTDSPPSPNTRKRLKKTLDKRPRLHMINTPTDNVSINSTPVSDLKRKCAEAFGISSTPSWNRDRELVNNNDKQKQLPTPCASNKKINCTKKIIEDSDNISQQMESILSSLTKNKDEENSKKPVPPLSFTPCRARKSKQILHLNEEVEELPKVQWNSKANDDENMADSLSTTDKELLEKCEQLENIPKENRLFILSNIANRKEEYESIILELGGKIRNEGTFHPDITHLLTDTPMKSEKIISCIASGRWMLHPSYLLACKKHGSFLPEKDYEWGNPKSKLPNLTGEPEKIAKAAYYWRKELDGKNIGAYNGMKFVLFSDKLSAMTRTIISGGGQVIDTSKVFSATHCIVDSNQSAKQEKVISTEELKKHSISIVKPTFLCRYLFLECEAK